MQQYPALTPQQEAIREARTRYERGDMPFDRFESTLTALLAAQTPEECRTIIQELPAAPVNPLDALTPLPPALPAPKLPDKRRLISVMGELKRTKHPWRMGQRTTVVMGLGELALDMSIATMPAHSILRVYVLAGEASLYVPASVHVSVRAVTLIGEAKAFGESREGIFAHLDEEAFPTQGTSAAPAPHLEIRAFLLAGELTIKQVDAPIVTLEMAQGQPMPPALPQPQ
jgi:hypothetical protein